MQKFLKIANISPVWLVVAAALAVRLAAALFDGLSHPTDLNAFRAWGAMLNSLGFANFYASEAFTDYPPGYMYVLAAMDGLRRLMGFEFASLGHNVVVKLPAMLADAVTVLFIYKIAVKFDNWGGQKFALTAALLYALNPAVIINSAIWGQVDAVHTLLMAVSIYFIAQNKMLASVLIFAVSIMVKPQSLIFSPIYLFMFYKYIFGIKRPKFNTKKFGRLACYGLACFALMAAIALPFVDFAALPANPLTIPPVLRQYVDTFTTYPFVTHNAYNFYSLLGLNHHVSIYEAAFLGISFNTLGTAFLVLITFFAFFLLWRRHDAGAVFLVGAVLVLCTFMLSVRMHERYNFPALAMLLLASVTLRDRRLLWLYVGFSAAFFLNYVDVLMMSLAGFNWVQIGYTSRIFALPMAVLFVYTIYVVLTIFVKRDLFKFSMPAPKNKDVLISGAITLFYAAFAFTNLGNMVSPVSYFHAPSQRSVVVDFGEIRQVNRIQFMNGARHDQRFAIRFSEDGWHWYGPLELTAHEVFSWHHHYFDGVSARIVHITPTTHQLYLMEMAFKDQNLELLPVEVMTEIGHELFDEQHTVPAVLGDYMHSAFFDEIYHPRTAYEFIHGMHVLEWTHPPLGKVIISCGIEIFGMTPFGWRFMGALFGVLMLPLFYALAKKMFEDSFWAGIATFVFAFDFMHYTQTRLATIDTYVVFFLIGMYYCMYVYTKMNFFRQNLARTLVPLFFGGIFTGLAMASKWQGAYGAAGLAVIFCWVLLQRHGEYRADGAANEKFWRKAGLTCAACVGFFVIIPVTIYVLSYIPYWNTGSLYPERHFLAAVWQNQLDMFNYHTGLEAVHPFTSSWWQWIINHRPIWLFSNYLGGGMAQGISSFGNPLVWWAGIGGLVYCIYAAIARRDKTAIFLVIAYLAQILPWMLVPRIAFIYHYFPNVPFLVLMVVYALKESRLFAVLKVFSSPKKLAVSFALATFALFVLFYPVLTGIPVSRDFVDIYLRWLPTWVLLV